MTEARTPSPFRFHREHVPGALDSRLPASRTVRQCILLFKASSL